MSEEHTFDQLCKHVGDFLEKDVSFLRPESRLANAIPGLDSLRLEELLLHLEEAFHVKFSEEVLDHIDTLGDLSKHIQQLQSEVGR